MTAQEAIDKINESIQEKTQGFVKAEDLQEFKDQLATVKELAEKETGVKSEDLDAVKSAVAKIEGKIDAFGLSILYILRYE